MAKEHIIVRLGDRTTRSKCGDCQYLITRENWAMCDIYGARLECFMTQPPTPLRATKCLDAGAAYEIETEQK